MEAHFKEPVPKILYVPQSVSLSLISTTYVCFDNNSKKSLDKKINFHYKDDFYCSFSLFQ